MYLVLKALSSNRYLEIGERYIKIHVKIGYVASLWKLTCLAGLSPFL